MKNRRRNNIIIGTLCAVLVLMGVGYAILSTTLNIGATAKITGDFDIHFTSIARSSSTISDSSILSTIDAGTGITANTSSRAGTFTAILQKPTDYVIYEVSVANTGSIDGYLTFSFEDTNSNFDYYKDFYSVEFIRDDVNPAISTDILQPNASFSDPQVLVNTSGTRTYKIKVTFKKSATSFPDPTHVINNEQVGNFECSLNLTYSQQAPSQGNSGGNQSQILANDAWRVDSNGKVISFNSQSLSNGTLTIPATADNGSNIVSVDSASFSSSYTVAGYINDTTGQIFAVAIRDAENYNKLVAATNKFVNNQDFQIVSDPANIVFPSGVSYSIAYLTPDISMELENMTFDDYTISAVPTITTLDLRSATHLTTIGTGAFFSNQISEIKFNNVVTTIGHGAFYNNKLTSLTIPSSVTTIMREAFEINNLTTIDFSNATNLTTIGDYAFINNQLTSLDLSDLTNLTSIGINAFESQEISGNSVLVSIDASNKTKAQYDTISNNESWYDNHHSNFHITYSDYTCDYNDTCVAN